MKLNPKLLEKINKYFSEKKEVAVVYLYGSYAKGEERADSDIDLALLIDNRKSFKGFDIPQTRYTYDLEKLTGKKVEVQDLYKAPMDFAYRVISEGKILSGFDSLKRVEFEEKVLRIYFDIKPSINEYFKYLSDIAKKGDLGVRYI